MNLPPVAAAHSRSLCEAESIDRLSDFSQRAAWSPVAGASTGRAAAGGGKGSQNLVFLLLGHLEEVERSPKFSCDLVELGRRDLQLAMRLFQVEGGAAGLGSRISLAATGRRAAQSASTERRRSRTDRAWGCHTAQVLKTCWATGPMPLRG